MEEIGTSQAELFIVRFVGSLNTKIQSIKVDLTTMKLLVSRFLTIISLGVPASATTFAPSNLPATKNEQNLKGTALTSNLVSWTEFKNALNYTNYTEPSYNQYESFISGLTNASIVTKEEAAMALTHFIWESDGLITTREYKCVITGCPTQYKVPDCDDAKGQDYYGRGYIQLTWCFNYKSASCDLFGDDRLVKDPDLVARDEELAWKTAFWFWGKYVHPKLMGQPEPLKFGVTTKVINGGWECGNGASARTNVAKHRYEIYKGVRLAFGLEGDGDERGCYN